MAHPAHPPHPGGGRGATMPSTVVTHLLDADGDRLCNLDGPVVSAPALLQDAGDLVFCPICARMVLVSIVQVIHTRCGVDRGPMSTRKPTRTCCCKSSSH